MIVGIASLGLCGHYAALADLMVQARRPPHNMPCEQDDDIKSNHGRDDDRYERGCLDGRRTLMEALNAMSERI